MKIYVIKYSDGSEQDEMAPYHDTKESATQELMHYVKETGCSPFDYRLEEMERGVDECIATFDEARTRLGLKPNTDFTIAKNIHSENPIQLEDVARLVTEINPKHIGALIALNELFTIAEAWNKEDGFVPDFSDWNQDKWFPWFKNDWEAAGFVYAYSYNTPTISYAYFGSRLCFKSSERATQFGKQFAHLYNQVFLLEPFEQETKRTDGRDQNVMSCHPQQKEVLDEDWDEILEELEHAIFNDAPKKKNEPSWFSRFLRKKTR